MDKIRFTTFVGNDASGFFAGAQPNVQYELSQAGTVVSVPVERNNELRLQMSASGAL